MNTMMQPPVPQGRMGFDAAFARYEAIRSRLPQAVAPARQPRQAASLRDTFDGYDGYLFDSFGVLNVGERAIEGAAECLTELRALGKPFCVLTNAASYSSAEAHSKYARLGLDIRPEEIVSSRDVLLGHLAALTEPLAWGAIAAVEDSFADTSASIAHLHDMTDWDAAEGILFLSAARWSPDDQDRLIRSLLRRPRPVLVGNPDLVAPREDGLTIEPGYWAHDVQDRTGIVPRQFGKPFADAFSIAARRLGARCVAMVGDTLHTDILGAQAAGLGTILVADHGLFRGRDTATFIQRSGLVPDWIVPSI